MYSAVLYMFCAINMYVERERKRQSVLVGPGRSGGECPDEKEREYGSPHKDARQGEEGERERETERLCGSWPVWYRECPTRRKRKGVRFPTQRRKAKRRERERETERLGGSWPVWWGMPHQTKKEGSTVPHT